MLWKILSRQDIYSNRSKLVTNFFHYFAGAKGSIRTVRSVINRSEKTSQRLVPDKVTVNFTFDNVQCLMKDWRVTATVLVLNLIERGTLGCGARSVYLRHLS